MDHEIELVPRAEPENKALYGFNQKKLIELKRQLTDLLAWGYVWPSKSSFGVPVFFVNKKGGQLWMCVDNHTLDRVMVKTNYPLPRVAQPTLVG